LLTDVRDRKDFFNLLPELTGYLSSLRIFPVVFLFPFHVFLKLAQDDTVTVCSIGFLSGWMDLGWMVDLLPNQSHHCIIIKIIYQSLL